jgi:thioredoxin 1
VSPEGELTDEAFAARVLAAEQPVLVDFWAPGCVPCRKVSPLVREVGRRFADRLAVAALNVDQHPRSAGAYDGLSVPTLILFKGGHPVERLAGAVSRERLERAIASHLGR